MAPCSFVWCPRWSVLLQLSASVRSCPRTSRGSQGETIHRAIESPRIDRRGNLEPHLEQIPVEISREEIRLPGHELTFLFHGPAGRFDGTRRIVDRARIDQSKSEVRDPGTFPNTRRRRFEHDDIARARRLTLHETVAAIDGDHSKYALVKRERAIDIAHAEREVRQPMGADWLR